MLVSASLLISTLKIDGKLSIQLQSSDSDARLNWAMAECDHTGSVRALAGFDDTNQNQTVWQHLKSADEAFGELGKGFCSSVSTLIMARLTKGLLSVSATAWVSVWHIIKDNLPRFQPSLSLPPMRRQQAAYWCNYCPKVMLIKRLTLIYGTA